MSTSDESTRDGGFVLRWWAASLLAYGGAVLVCTAAAFPVVLAGWAVVRTAFIHAGITGGALALAFSLAAGYLACGALLLALLCCVARLVTDGWEGERDVGDPRNLGFFLVSAVRVFARHGFLPLLTGTPFIVAYYRAMGATIGSGTMIFTTEVSDCRLVEIGRDCTLGVDCVIQCHSGRAGRWVRRRVVIGDRVTIGRGALVMPGATIEDGVTVGAKSFVPGDSHLEQGKTYGGVPARELSDADESGV